MAGAGNDLPPVVAVKEFIGHGTVNAPPGPFAQGHLEKPCYEKIGLLIPAKSPDVR